MQRFVALFLMLCFFQTAANAAVVLINSDETLAQVSDNTVDDAPDPTNTGGTTAIATIPGYSSVTNSVLVNGIDLANFTATFDQLRQGDYNGYSAGLVTVKFKTNSDVSFLAGGTFTSSDGFTALVSYLHDDTDNSYVYNSTQASFGAPVVYTLGGSDGNAINQFDGSLTGIIVGGHNYEWTAQGFSQALPDADNGAISGGSVWLSLTPVPEAASAIVWSVLVLTVGGVGWWQKRKLVA